jgi:hypothetical protein
MAVKEDIVERVVNFLRDAKESNRILDRVETDAEQITILLDDVLEVFNQDPPTTGFTLKQLPKALLRDLTVIEILTSAGIWYTRNEMPYSSGGVTVQDYEGKGSTYASWCTKIEQRAERLKTKIKVQANIESLLTC